MSAREAALAVVDSQRANMPDSVATVLRHLAHLLDASITAHRGEDAEAFAARHLGGHIGELVAISESFGQLSFTLATSALAHDVATQNPKELSGLYADSPPRWRRVHTGVHAKAESLPADLVVAFEAGSVSEHPVVVRTEVEYNDYMLTVYAKREHAGTAETYLQELVRRGREENNFYRGKVIRASANNAALEFELSELPPSSRTELVLPESLWKELDTNVSGLFHHREQLSAAGLGTNRGVLLAGPPGTGKSALCRVVANELAGEVTVVLVDAKALAGAVGLLYKELAFLGSSLVILEDIDLIVGHRKGRGDTLSLVEFLTALDGVMSAQHDVVTIATTNDPDAIDPAAKRAARFDAVLHVPTPDHEGRKAILSTYLSKLDLSLELDEVARRTENASGADLKELVRRTVLEHGGKFEVTQLLEVCKGGRWEPTAAMGQYI